MRRKKRKRYDGVDVTCFVCLTLLAVLIIVPFWNAVVLSFSTQSAWVEKPFALWPVEFTWNNFGAMAKQAGGLVAAYRNTVLLAFVGTLAGMVVTAMTAYGFTRSFPGKKGFFYLMLFSMFFGGGLIPTYLLVKNLGLLNKLSSLILLSVPSAYNIIVMKNGFESIPKDLPEAATMDGASELTIFTKIMVPLQKPIIATFSLFTVVGYWNSWFWPMLAIDDPKKHVLQVFLRGIILSATNLANQEVTAADTTSRAAVYPVGIQMAAVFVVMLPIMLVYPFLQKYFVKGMLVGGIKM